MSTLVTPCTVARQAPLSMGFPWQKYWSGLPFPPPGDLPDPGIEPTSPVFFVFTGGFFTTMPPRKPHNTFELSQNAKNTVVLWGKKIILW